MYLISGCLLGYNCKYDGGNNRNEKVAAFCREHDFAVICPESAAKLPQPRDPAEWKDGRLVNRSGKDLTEDFLRGARICMEYAEKTAAEKGQKIEGAILKAKSPSCGSGKIYDGTFSGTLTDGDGCFTTLLKQRGIPVITEKDELF